MTKELVKEKKLINKKAGFWIKLISRLLDILPVAGIAITSAFLYMSHTPYQGSVKNVWHFVHPWEFYIWGVTLIVMLLLQFILVPIVTNGQSFGQWITRVKVTVEKGSIREGILKREAFFSMAWIVSSILVIALINHTLISKYAASDQKDLNYTTWESLRIGIVTTVGSVVMLLQMVIGISVLVRRDKKGLHDVYAKTKVVYVNRFIELKSDTDKSIERARPQPHKNILVEWVN